MAAHVVRRAIELRRRKPVNAVVPPTELARERRDRHHLDECDADIAQVAKPDAILGWYGRSPDRDMIASRRGALGTFDKRADISSSGGDATLSLTMLNLTAGSGMRRARIARRGCATARGGCSRNHRQRDRLEHRP